MSEKRTYTMTTAEDRLFATDNSDGTISVCDWRGTALLTLTLAAAEDVIQWMTHAVESGRETANGSQRPAAPTTGKGSYQAGDGHG